MQQYSPTSFSVRGDWAWVQGAQQLKDAAKKAESREAFLFSAFSRFSTVWVLHDKTRASTFFITYGSDQYAKLNDALFVWVFKRQCQSQILTLSASPGHGAEPAALLSGPLPLWSGLLGKLHSQSDQKRRELPRDTPPPIQTAPEPASLIPLVGLASSSRTPPPFDPAPTLCSLWRPQQSTRIKTWILTNSWCALQGRGYRREGGGRNEEIINIKKWNVLHKLSKPILKTCFFKYTI